MSACGGGLVQPWFPMWKIVRAGSRFLFSPLLRRHVCAARLKCRRQASLLQGKLAVSLLGRGLCGCRGPPTAQPPSWDCSRPNSPWTVVHNLVMNFAVNCFSKQIFICDILNLNKGFKGQFFMGCVTERSSRQLFKHSLLLLRSAACFLPGCDEPPKNQISHVPLVFKKKTHPAVRPSVEQRPALLPTTVRVSALRTCDDAAFCSIAVANGKGVSVHQHPDCGQ